MIDFGESHRAEMASDIAIALKELIIYGKAINWKILKTYLDAYQKINKLNREELMALPFLIRRRIVFMLSYYVGKKDKIKVKKELGVLKLLQRNKKLLEDFCNLYAKK